MQEQYDGGGKGQLNNLSLNCGCCHQQTPDYSKKSVHFSWYLAHGVCCRSTRPKGPESGGTWTASALTAPLLPGFLKAFVAGL